VIDWQYNPPDGLSIVASPTIGPDGLLYGAFEISGAFAIEPLTGQLVWSNPGQPMMNDKSGEAVEAKFGPDGIRILTDFRRHAQNCSFPPINPATISHQASRLPAATFASSNLVS